jgi:hypothetical protein
MKKPVYTALSLVGVIAAIAFLSAQSQSQDALAPEISGRMLTQGLTEVSGMVKSRSYPNTYWAVSDSGNDARLFAINRDGNTIIPTFSKFSFYGEEREQGKDPWPGFRVLYTENVDWEDMTADDNYIYVADTGNNFNNRRDLKIYMLSEIDPTASTQSAAIKTLPVRYPEQVDFPGDGPFHYDSESLFSADGKLYLITKHRGRFGRYEAGANLYRLDTDFTEQPNYLVLVGNHAGIVAATGAELSPDGQKLAVISYTDLWIFDRPAEGDQWLSASGRSYPLNTNVFRQVETVIWDDDETLILSNEQRDLFRIDLVALGE